MWTRYLLASSEYSVEQSTAPGRRGGHRATVDHGATPSGFATDTLADRVPETRL